MNGKILATGRQGFLRWIVQSCIWRCAGIFVCVLWLAINNKISAVEDVDDTHQITGTHQSGQRFI